MKHSGEILYKARFFVAGILMLILLTAGAFYAFETTTVDMDAVVDDAFARKEPVTRLVTLVETASRAVRYHLAAPSEETWQKRRDASEQLQKAFRETVERGTFEEEELRRMKTYAPSHIRNVAVVGHGNSGKTSISAPMSRVTGYSSTAN